MKSKELVNFQEIQFGLEEGLPNPASRYSLKGSCLWGFTYFSVS
jgi:hypothetical protein